ncbi:MAG TPA: ribosomal L7Ae/L30e/S12e/Gadd45 family protein [Paenibacillus sp.]|uniref:L7Ae/L30e/S12e/Gadd45 family ribosomal protein n=1 Tax=Paenibacillus sp. TaxID=58172 RepID=UPI0028D0DD61|nr:ribosomal L7Ae/L30e/S12e/Gadd45 family protein [Paenibacillus sp.]HUC90929.1 ribosomal L7Ae/L30e/S12e/Gadd45 family protein [Paenibacillus sp.]
MTAKHKALSALGMAMRAGKLATGDETVLKAVKQGKAALVLVAGDASDNTKKKYRDKCATYGVPLLEVFDRFTLGAAIGKEERVIVGVADSGFAGMIRSHLGTHSEVEEY